MAEADPLTKVAIMLAIRQLARDQADAVKPLDALEWALERNIVRPRAGITLMDAGRQDDLVLTEHGRQVVVAFWEKQEQKRAIRRREALR